MAGFHTFISLAQSYLLLFGWMYFSFDSFDLHSHFSVVYIKGI